MRSAAISGTTSPRSPTRICRRWARSRGTIPSPASRSTYTMPAGGRGYTRPPSLVSVWSTAPFLLNNYGGSVRSGARRWKRRMRSFKTSIEQMLWPEKRDQDAVLGDKVPGMIDRTTQQSFLRVSPRLCAGTAAWHVGIGQAGCCPGLFGSGGIELGPDTSANPRRSAGQPEILSEDPIGGAGGA